MSRRVLIVDSGTDLRARMSEACGDRGWTLAQVGSPDAALEECRLHDYELVVAAEPLVTEHGLERLVEAAEQASLVVWAGAGSRSSVASWLERGAFDAVVGDDPADLIPAKLDRAIERSILVEQNRGLLAELQRRSEILEGVGSQLRDLANRDVLTGLYNDAILRDSLQVELSRSRRHGRPLSLLALDVDRLTEFNDAHGRLAGDDLLRRVAWLLDTQCRASTVLAHVGAGRFLILVTEVDSEGATKYAERIRAAIGENEFLGDHKVSVSIGVAGYPQAAQDAGTLLDRANEALSRAKTAGRDCVVCIDTSVPSLAPS